MAASLARSAAVVRTLMKTAVLTQLQYRADFIIQSTMQIFWAAWTLVPLLVIFQLRPTVAGYTRGEALLVLAAFMALKAVLEGVINPNMLAVVEHIRSGTLDFVLLKPVDSQLLVSASRINPAKIVDVLFAIGLLSYALPDVSPQPGPLQFAYGLLLLLAGSAMLYGLWLLVICSAFWFVRIDNLAYLFGSLFDAGRWPIDVFRGWVRAMLTFVLPIAVMTSYPVLATLGRLEARPAAIAIATSIALLFVSRQVWRWALTRYASASS